MNVHTLCGAYMWIDFLLELTFDQKRDSESILI